MLLQKVKALRKKKGWSQQKLAQEAGLSFNAITKIEQGKAKHPTLKTLVKLADVFKISLDELTGRLKIKLAESNVFYAAKKIKKKANIIIPLKIKKYLEEADWIAVATSDSQGRPNVANKFLIKCEQSEIFLVDYMQEKTWENIQQNHAVAFPIIDLENLIDYQISGRAELLDKGIMHDQLVEQLTARELQFSTKRIIEGIRREKAHRPFEFSNMKDAVIIKIKVTDIVSTGQCIRAKKLKNDFVQTTGNDLS
ncbi:MAG: helix-turn-helix domain-containing protein [Candidatus Omnitrophota bacterium]